MEEQRLILVNVAGNPGFNRSGYSLTFTASIFQDFNEWESLSKLLELPSSWIYYYKIKVTPKFDVKMNRINGLSRCWNKCVPAKLKLVIYLNIYIYSVYS